MKKKNKIFLLLSTYFVILFSPKSCSDNSSDTIIYNSEYVYENASPYGQYNGKNIYFVNRYNINEIPIEEDGIFIIDSRFINNSDVRINKSYRITDKHEMRQIIKMILEYEKEYPSNWSRTEESMMNEWNIHNICYELNIDRVSTEHVDFDNQDEEKYDSKVLSKILGN